MRKKKSVYRVPVRDITLIDWSSQYSTFAMLPVHLLVRCFAERTVNYNLIHFVYSRFGSCKVQSKPVPMPRTPLCPKSRIKIQR